MSKKIAEQIINHSDKDEIISKLVCEISPQEIWEWLSAKYSDQKNLIISKKSLQIFKDEYLDLYSTIREDLLKTQFNITAHQEIQSDIQGNAAYKKRLAEIADKELDIKSIIKTLVVKIEMRADQIFEMVQNDPSNTKMDRGLIEWMNLLLNTLEKFDIITNGPQDNIVVNNTYNIQIDNHINMISDIVRETLSQLDYETSLQFTETFTRRLAELKASDKTFVAPVEKRLEAAYSIQEETQEKLLP